MAGYTFDEASVARIREAVRFVERASRGGDPGRARWPAGAGGGGVDLLGKGPSGGIAANASGTVTLYTYGTVGTLSSTTLTITNPWPDAIPANSKILIGTVNGVPNCAKTWSCTGV